MKTMRKLYDYTMEELQDSIRAATANVVRYPNGFVYNAGPSPFCGCGCGNGYGNI